MGRSAPSHRACIKSVPIPIGTQAAVDPDSAHSLHSTPRGTIHPHAAHCRIRCDEAFVLFLMFLEYSAWHRHHCCGRLRVVMVEYHRNHGSALLQHRPPPPSPPGGHYESGERGCAGTPPHHDRRHLSLVHDALTCPSLFLVIMVTWIWSIRNVHAPHLGGRVSPCGE